MHPNRTITVDGIKNTMNTRRKMLESITPRLMERRKLHGRFEITVSRQGMGRDRHRWGLLHVTYYQPWADPAKERATRADQGRPRRPRRNGHTHTYSWDPKPDPE